MTPLEGAQQAERRTGKPCYYASQKVPGIFACVACQFRINNRGVLPACPDCGEIIWAYMLDGDRPIPEGATSAPPPVAQAEGGGEAAVDIVQPTNDVVKVEEGINLEM